MFASSVLVPSLMIVSSLLIQRDSTTSHPVELYISRFRVLCDTLNKLSIHVTLFLDKKIDLPYEFPNLKINKISIDDLDSFNRMKNADIKKVMDAGNPGKNTLDYHIINNGKINLVNKVIEESPNFDRYAWVDCGIIHMMQKPEETISNLSNIYKTNTGVTIPGCHRNKSDYINYPNWRFCGSFFTGDVKSLKEMEKLSKQTIDSIMPTATWEVNIWAHMEKNLGWNPNWYPADHNDSILRFPHEPMV